MKFDQIDSSIPKQRLATAKGKFQGLFLELGTREDNYHVGSGIGGNGAQLFALMTFSHELVNDPLLTIDVDRGLIRWGSSWLEHSARKAIRYELDAKLPIPKYTPLDSIRKDARFSLGPNVSNLDVLIFACNLCHDLAVELDKGDESKVKPTALALRGFPMEVTLVAVRKHIQIDRLVRHNLDEHPDFSMILHTINKTVDQ